MQHRSINLEEEFGLFREQWQPKVLAEMTDYQFKIVRLEGDFAWHSHEDTDEALSCSVVPCESPFATEQSIWALVKCISCEKE